jgi:hypothetical protein
VSNWALTAGFTLVNAEKRRKFPSDPDREGAERPRIALARRLPV